MAYKERNIQIVSLGGGQFEMVEDGSRGQDIVSNKNGQWIKGKKMKETDDFKIYFSLDENGDFKFVDIEDDVMWINKGSQNNVPPCPTVQTHQKPEFKVDGVDDYVLEVTNKDTSKCYYKFVINLVDKNTGQTVPYDPIWDNRNGGVSLANQ